ncbi:hypothetical protein E4V01_07810 [Methylorubrum sp. Q1]|uniref:hypothetical protein n=1 Tax=Methylorubrum sp. Q1 TaxID=2562453 RepID=UPI001076358C|nr:hypothetical protein [Methylorubrum sp. Q1]TFZ59344.1 hypothetical protein E4V01_07810 [Methylorubrum sp. Q1]
MNDDGLEERLATLERQFWMEKGRSKVMHRAIGTLLVDLRWRDPELLASVLQSLEAEPPVALHKAARDAYSKGHAEGLLELRKRIAEIKEGQRI